MTKYENTGKKNLEDVYDTAPDGLQSWLYSKEPKDFFLQCKASGDVMDGSINNPMTSRLWAKEKNLNNIYMKWRLIATEENLNETEQVWRIKHLQDDTYLTAEPYHPEEEHLDYNITIKTKEKLEAVGNRD